MSWNHSVLGWNHLDGFVRALDVVGVPYYVDNVEDSPFYPVGSDLYAFEERRLRRVHFATNKGIEMVAQEYLQYVTSDADGADQINFFTYFSGDAFSVPETLYDDDSEVWENE